MSIINWSPSEKEKKKKNHTTVKELNIMNTIQELCYAQIHHRTKITLQIIKTLKMHITQRIKEYSKDLFN